MASGAKISCPSDEVLHAFLAGKAPPAQVPQLAQHLDECERCRQRVLSAAKAFASTQGSKASLRPHQAGQGDLIGRYVVLARLGSGAMGTVYVAFDPELERKVALKVLSAQGGGSKGRELVGEAQALARLSHPNVVPVYDAGEHEGHVFIAMELVRGTTLREWLATPRKPNEVLRLFRQFGLGLRAAHQAGLVHRDIKPENLLVGEDGRGRVSDFGLARLVEEPVESQTGSMLVGTPAYMSPEQLDRKPADARSDQFSFCATLHEALYGRRPFPGESLGELREQMHKRPLIPLKVGVALAIRQGLGRGLSEDPAQRFESLDPLLERLELAGVWPRRVAIGLAMALAAGAIVAATLRYAKPQQAPAPCAGAERLLAGTWDQARSSALLSALKQSSSSAARESADVVKAELDLWARDWVSERTQACEATRVRHEQSEQMLDRRVACLDRRMQEVRALLEVLQWGQAEVGERAVQAVEAITPVAVCADKGTLLDVTPMPVGAGERQKVNEALQRLSRAKAVLDSAQPTPALTEAKLALAVAADAGYPPLEAEARLQVGLALEGEGQHVEAAAVDGEAYAVANAAHDDRTAARAATHAYRESGRTEATRPASAVWKTVARSSISRTGDDPALLGELTYLEAFGAYDAADFKTAAPRFQAACELYLKAFGPSVDLGNCLVREGEAWVQAGDFAKAEDRWRAGAEAPRSTAGGRPPAGGGGPDPAGHRVHQPGRPRARHRLPAPGAGDGAPHLPPRAPGPLRRVDHLGLPGAGAGRGALGARGGAGGAGDRPGRQRDGAAAGRRPGGARRGAAALGAGEGGGGRGRGGARLAPPALRCLGAGAAHRLRRALAELPGAGPDGEGARGARAGGGDRRRRAGRAPLRRPRPPLPGAGAGEGHACRAGQGRCPPRRRGAPLRPAGGGVAAHAPVERGRFGARFAGQVTARRASSLPSARAS